MTDVCPGCGGVADNGHDLCDPPNVYLCSKCEQRPIRPGEVVFVDEAATIPDHVWPAVAAAVAREELEKKRKARRAELVWQAYLVALADETLRSYGAGLAWSEQAVDAFLKWEEEQ